MHHKVSSAQHVRNIHFTSYSIRRHMQVQETHSPRSHIRSHREMLSRSFPSSSSSSSSFSSRKPAAAAWANNRLEAPLPRPRPRLLAALWRTKGSKPVAEGRPVRARGRRTTNAATDPVEDAEAADAVRRRTVAVAEGAETAAAARRRAVITISSTATAQGAAGGWRFAIEGEGVSM